MVEVAHEALLRQWPALDVWLDIESDALRTLEGLRRAAGEWKKNEKKLDWLVHSGDRLANAELILTRPDFQQSLGDGLEYVNACKRHAAELQAEREAQIKRIEQGAREVFKHRACLRRAQHGRTMKASSIVAFGSRC